ncbi:YALI0F08525p [Yarrowia lipolytica CLIB122]|uniref:YALI0F08525p n=2 Tax=Yarrowia lipolytica TaxID=4952 RepID=Q6C2E7_YARLI|nr:YALI0F08525p [Yarrowia lipolytica CLIB122]AOW06858.1 hypothetical protein YALI1_F11907g [Yarrowia lipolytica]KAB8284078.1 hypothetical protein BKA91DRAFT_8674 [Yarrowia lipolytica]KAE8173665.1 hypothetical protein BKA90DRAFT_6389 [Yarrowia lipolytica]RMI97768.1 hypothetical protein BD777DRAFT_87570 [Yarrowia lipolytica]CAG77972.1 YALI0F08525p [Yarrowia lipolytica CLIB122]|eukprot:XP_505165.1 YALI0F08525p [Yarrowia lipolytica CLIB122]
MLVDHKCMVEAALEFLAWELAHCPTCSHPRFSPLRELSLLGYTALSGTFHFSRSPTVTCLTRHKMPQPVTIKLKRNKKVVMMECQPKETMEQVKARLVALLPTIGPSGLSDLDVEMTDIPVPLTEYETTTSSTNKGKQPETELGEIRLAVLEGELWVEIEDYKKQKVGDYNRDFVTFGWADEGEDFVVL